MPHHPHHQYAQPTQHAYPVYRAPTYVSSSRTLLTAGVVGTVVGGTSALAANLHKVQDKQMTTKEAVANSLATGAGAGVATATGVAVASAVRAGGFVSLALMAATATGVGYLLYLIGKSVSEKAVST